LPDHPITIGLFDSGVGGLSVLRVLRLLVPQVEMIFVADQAHVPYGTRTLEEVRSFSVGITRFLIEQGAGLVVVACNTASAAALYHLRAIFPDLPFVGMEPALKPAAEQSQSRVVGVLATPATFQGKLYASVVNRFARGLTVLEDTCPGLVAQIEAGDLEGPRTREILETALHPMLARGADRVVLGCTHYPFVIPLIGRVIQDYLRASGSIRPVEVIDPAPAVASQAVRLLAGIPGARQASGTDAPLRLFTTGQTGQLEALLPRLLNMDAPVRSATWDESRLTV